MRLLKSSFCTCSVSTLRRLDSVSVLTLSRMSPCRQQPLVLLFFLKQCFKTVAQVLQLCSNVSCFDCLPQWLRRRWCVPYVTSEGSKGRVRPPDPLVFTVRLAAIIVSDNPDSARRLTLDIKRNDQSFGNGPLEFQRGEKSFRQTHELRPTPVYSHSTRWHLGELCW